MRKLLIISALLLSASSWARVTLRFTSEYLAADNETASYVVEATFDKNPDNPMRGEVFADVQSGSCSGKYELNLTKPKGQLSISFEDTDGTNRCQEQSLEVDITAEQYATVLTGQKWVEVTFRSMAFAQTEMAAKVVMINF